MKVDKKSGQSAYDIILARIMNMEYKPNEVITEMSLSDQLGISRTPIRNAIQRLEIEGLIVTEHRTKKIHYLTAKDIENIFDLKISIESRMAYIAAQKGNDAQMQKLESIVSRIKHLVRKRPEGEYSGQSFFEEWLKADRDFHDAIFEMADNQRARQIIQTLNAQWHRIRVGLSAIEGRVEKSAMEHETIGTNIIARNAEGAEKAVKDHLENLKSTLLHLMKAFSNLYVQS